MNEKQTLQKEIMNYEFVLRDVGLYLDTHPSDISALAEYNKNMKLREHALQKYNEKYGTYMLGDSEVTGNRWNWVDSPWPWEGEVQ